MKLSIAGVGALVISGSIVAACSASNAQYARDLQQCILDARDAGDSGEVRLAAYNRCADDLDTKDGGK